MQPTAQSFWHSADLKVCSGRAFVCFKEKVLSFTKETEVASQQEHSVFGHEVWSLRVCSCEANWEVNIGRRCKFEWLFVIFYVALKLTANIFAHGLSAPIC